MFLLNENSTVFEHADPYVVSDFVNQHVGPHCIRKPSAVGISASLHHRKYGDLDLCRISYGGVVRVTSPTLGSLYHLQIVLKGQCLWRQGSSEHFLASGELLFINPDDAIDLTYSHDCEKFILKLPVSLLQAVCAEHRWKIPEQGVRFARHLHHLGRMQNFIRLLGMICSEAEEGESTPQMQQHYARIVASKLLAQLSNNIDEQLLVPTGNTFDRLLQYIEENLLQDISIEQLSITAQMSPRSLYSLFERNLGCSPKYYVRERKLLSVYNRLTNSSCHRQGVTEIALDHGFLHLGRFSETYRKRFGELPSTTLKRR
jgi:AraC-like DNA-binding protein